MDERLILWEHNPARSFIDDMTPEEIDLFEADMNDAIDGVIEDWRNK